MFTLGSRAVFVTATWIDGSGYVYELWSTDGTAAGTQTIGLTDPSSIDRVELVASTGSQAFFQVVRGGHLGTELWQTDGTVDGTHLVRGGLDVGYGILGLSTNVPPGIGFEQKFLFVGDDGSTGLEPWISDGTDGGTHVLRDINSLAQLDAPAPAAGVPYYMDGLDVITGPNPTLTGSAPDGATVVLFDLFRGELARGTSVGGTYSITLGAIPYNSADIVAVVAGPGGEASVPTWPVRNQLWLRIDAEAPRLQFNQPQFVTSPVPTLKIFFDEPVSDSVSADDLVIKNLTTGKRIPSSAMALSFDPSGAQLSVTFPGLASGRLPAGTYSLTIARDNITDRVGNPLAQDVDFSWMIGATVRTHPIIPMPGGADFATAWALLDKGIDTSLLDEVTDMV
jgi:ELWxxDGT repeat protein